MTCVPRALHLLFSFDSSFFLFFFLLSFFLFFFLFRLFFFFCVFLCCCGVLLCVACVAVMWCVVVVLCVVGVVWWWCVVVCLVCVVVLLCVVVCHAEKTPVCAFKTPACVRSKRLRVYRHHAHILKSMCAWCRYTRGRFERTHAAVLNAHTEGLSLSPLSFFRSPSFSLFLSSSLSLFLSFLSSFIFPCLVDDSSNHSLYLIKLFNFSYPE